MKTILDRIEALPEDEARFALKAILLTAHVSEETMDRALNLAACIRKPS